MATYSTGLLKVGTLNAEGISAELRADTATITNLTATNVNATNFNFTTIDDLNVTGNLTVGGKTSSLDVSGNLAVSEELRVGTFNFINQNVSNTLKTKLDSVNNSYAWDATRNPEVVNNGTTTIPVPGFGNVPALQALSIAIPGFPSTYNTKLPFVQYDGSFNGSFNPVVCNTWNIGDNDQYSFFKGKRRSGLGSNNTMDASNTLFNWASMTKIVNSLLYARMCTLGVFEQGKPIPVEDYIPVLKTIEFLVPYYEDFIVDSSSYFDLSGNRAAWNIKDGSGNPFVVPYNDPSGYNLVPPGQPAPIRELLGVEGKYVNVYKSNRKLFLHDCLAESVGFVTGFSDYYAGVTAEITEPTGYNRNYNFGWDAAVTDKITFPDASGFWKGNASSAGKDFFGAGLCYNPTLDVLFGTNNSTGWNNASPAARAVTGLNRFPLANTPLEHITKFFEQFSGRKYMQLFEHGTFNYNSSDTFTPAVLTAAYKQKFPDASAATYYDIMHKELFQPLMGNAHSFTYYFDQSGNAPNGPYNTSQIATCWDLYTPSGTNFLQDLSSYIVHISNDNSINGISGVSMLNAGLTYNNLINTDLSANAIAAAQACLQKPSIYRYFTDGSAGTTKAQLYLSTLGLHSTINDYNKILALLNNKGVYRDPTTGVLKRLINNSDIQIISTPAISVLTQQNQYNNFFALSGSTFSGEVFANGQCMVGPSYVKGLSVNGSMLPVPNPYLYPGASANVSTAYTTVANIPIDGSVWSGINGCNWFSFPSKNTYGISVMMGNQLTCPQQYQYLNANTDVVYNELVFPGSTNVVARATW